MCDVTKGFCRAVFFSPAITERCQTPWPSTLFKTGTLPTDMEVARHVTRMWLHGTDSVNSKTWQHRHGDGELMFVCMFTFNKKVNVVPNPFHMSLGTEGHLYVRSLSYLPQPFMDPKESGIHFRLVLRLEQVCCATRVSNLRLSGQTPLFYFAQAKHSKASYSFQY